MDEIEEISCKTSETREKGSMTVLVYNPLGCGIMWVSQR